ncbi:MAG: response regulator transcription factor [Armatimonadia bacterium]
MSIRIVLADDHKVIREGMRLLFEREPDLELVGEASTAAEAIERVEDLKPDVVLMDISMADISGTEATRIIIERHPDARVIAFSMHADSYIMMLFKAAGGMGYVLKDEPFERVKEAIHEVMAGHEAFPEGVV